MAVVVVDQEAAVVLLVAVVGAELPEIVLEKKRSIYIYVCVYVKKYHTSQIEKNFNENKANQKKQNDEM
jgi:hypothetical protein